MQRRLRWTPLQGEDRAIVLLDYFDSAEATEPWWTTSQASGASDPAVTDGGVLAFITTNDRTALEMYPRLVALRDVVTELQSGGRVAFQDGVPLWYDVTCVDAPSVAAVDALVGIYDAPAATEPLYTEPVRLSAVSREATVERMARTLFDRIATLGGMFLRAATLAQRGGIAVGQRVTLPEPT